MSTHQTASAARAQTIAFAEKQLEAASREFQDDVTRIKNDYPKIGRCSGSVFYYDQEIVSYGGISEREVAETVASLERDGYRAVPEKATQRGMTPRKSSLTISWCTPADLVPKK